MESLHILFSFDRVDFEQAVKDLLKTKGYEAVIHHRYSKVSVKDYLEYHPECNAVVLKEAFNKEDIYAAEELAQLTDLRDINVVVVLSENRRGTEYMGILYSAGIVNAIFQKGRRGGGTPAEIAALLLRKRSRKEAREYYGISSQKINFGFLENETYMEFYKKLKNGSGTLIENYVAVCSQMSPQQIADFTRRLPADDMKVLVEFKEFHVIIQLLKKVGMNIKVKKPKNVRIGLSVPVGISVKDNAIHIDGTDTAEISSDPDSIKSGEQNAEPIVNTSLAALFSGTGEKTASLDRTEVEVEVSVETKTSEQGIQPESNVNLSSYFSSMDADMADDDEDEDDGWVDEEIIFAKGEERCETDAVLEISHEAVDVLPKQDLTNDVEKDVVDYSTVSSEDDVFADDGDEEDVTEKITFEGYDSAYDDIALGSGVGGFISVPFIVAVVFLVAAIVSVYIFGNANVVKLF